MIKYVIFDFDGTLADSKNSLISAWNSLADKYQFKKIKYEDLESLKTLSIKERSKLLNFPMYKMPIVIPELYSLYRQSIKDITLFDGIKNVLDELESRGYQTAIISSNSEDNIKEFLQRNEVESITEVICSSRIFGKDKMIKNFIKSHNLQVSEVIYVGDEHRDIVACKKSGVKVIWVGWGYDAAELVQTANPDYMVYVPEQILQVI